MDNSNLMMKKRLRLCLIHYSETNIEKVITDLMHFPVNNVPQMVSQINNPFVKTVVRHTFSSDSYECYHNLIYSCAIKSQLYNNIIIEFNGQEYSENCNELFSIFNFLKDILPGICIKYDVRYGIFYKLQNGISFNFNNLDNDLFMVINKTFETCVNYYDINTENNCLSSNTVENPETDSVSTDCNFTSCGYGSNNIILQKTLKDRKKRKKSFKKSKKAKLTENVTSSDD